MEMEARKNTTKVTEYLEEIGAYLDDVTISLLNYLSDDEVKDWAESNGYWPDEDDEEEDEDVKDNLSEWLHELNMEQREQM